MEKYLVLELLAYAPPHIGLNSRNPFAKSCALSVISGSKKNSSASLCELATGTTSMDCFKTRGETSPRRVVRCTLHCFRSG